MRHCRPKIVLLDFDGTIVDTMKYYADIASRLIEEIAGIPRLKAREMYVETAGRPFRVQLSLMGVESGAEEIAARFEEEKKGILKSLRLHDEVKLFLEKVRGMGLRVFLSTNNECGVVKSNPGLTSVFDGVLCHDPETGEAKGEPHVRVLQDRFGVDRCEIVFIGDSIYDVELHKALGVRVIRTRGLWAPGEADRIAEELRVLLDG